MILKYVFCCRCSGVNCESVVKLLAAALCDSTVIVTMVSDLVCLKCAAASVTRALIMTFYLISLSR